MSDAEIRAEIEYQHRADRRYTLVMNSYLLAFACAATSAIVMNTDPFLGTVFAVGGVPFVLSAGAATGDNLSRRLLNKIPSISIEDIERPKSNATEALADD